MRSDDDSTARGMRSALAVAITAVVAFALLHALLQPSDRAAAAAPALLAVAAQTPTAAPLPLPLQMADIGDSRQLLVATAADIGDTTGTLQVFDLVDGVWVLKLAVPARFGRHGLMDGATRKAGNLTTPTGIWAMPTYMFGTHAHAPAGSQMRYRRLDSRSWWSSKKGRTYNRWVEARHWKGEHIGGSRKAYEFAVSVGYNAAPNPSIYGRGTGIFLHVRGAGLTSGCVAVSRANMIRICRILDRRKHPHFAVGTLQVGTPTSIWAY